MTDGADQNPATSPGADAPSPPGTAARPPARPGLMRSLGEFFGHIVHAAKTDPVNPAAERQVVRESVEEETREIGGGKVVLRRTTVEEIELQRKPPTQ